MDEKALFKLSYGLYFVGAKGKEKANACVSNTVVQVTNTPNKLSVTLNKDHYTTKCIEESGYFSVSVMDQSVTMDTIGRFGFSSGKDKDKFEGFSGFGSFEGGAPYIKEGVCAVMLVKVEGSMDVGTHKVFFGEVSEALTLNDTAPLTYADYHNIKKGTTPKSAPSYVPPAENKGWKCSICGYVYEGDPLPEDFICPVCGRPASFFKKI